MEHLSELQKSIFFLSMISLFHVPVKHPRNLAVCRVFVGCSLFVGGFFCRYLFVVCRLLVVFFSLVVQRAFRNWLDLTCFFVSNLFESLVFFPLTCLGLKFSVVRRNSGPASRP